MTDYTVKRLALVLEVQAGIEGMKAANLPREQNGESQAYGSKDFNDAAMRLGELAYAHDEQL